MDVLFALGESLASFMTRFQGTVTPLSPDIFDSGRPWMLIFGFSNTGFGDNRFSNVHEVATMMRRAAYQTCQGFNKFFVVLRQGRVSAVERKYLEFIESLFGESALKHCTIIFTFCPDQVLSRTKSDFVNQLKQDGDIELLLFVERCGNVLFADNAIDEDPEVEEVYSENRQKFLALLLTELDDSPASGVLPVATTAKELLSKLLVYLLPGWFSKNIDEAIADSLKAFDGKSVGHYFDTCAICLDAISELPFATKCGHLFHTHCLLQALERKQECPQCRQPVKHNENCFSEFTKE